MTQQILKITLSALIAGIITKIIYKIKSYIENSKIFEIQLNWYRLTYGDEHTSHLLKEIQKSGNPHKFLNEIMKGINPELVNKNIES
jgi:hypothetical protein